MSLRRYAVFDKLIQEVVRVEHIVRSRVVYLKVQMRGCRVPRIAAKGNELACADGHVRWFQASIGHTGFMAVLVLSQGSLDTGRKSFQVAVDRGLARGMSNVDGITKAVESDGDTRHIAVGNGIEMLTLDAIRTDVKTAMKVMGTRFAEIPRQ